MGSISPSPKDASNPVPTQPAERSIKEELPNFDLNSFTNEFDAASDPSDDELCILEYDSLVDNYNKSQTSSQSGKSPKVEISPSSLNKTASSSSPVPGSLDDKVCQIPAYSILL